MRDPYGLLEDEDEPRGREATPNTTDLAKAYLSAVGLCTLYSFSGTTFWDASTMATTPDDRVLPSTHPGISMAVGSPTLYRHVVVNCKELPF